MIPQCCEMSGSLFLFLRGAIIELKTVIKRLPNRARVRWERKPCSRLGTTYRKQLARITVIYIGRCTHEEAIPSSRNYMGIFLKRRESAIQPIQKNGEFEGKRKFVWRENLSKKRGSRVHNSLWVCGCREPLEALILLSNVPRAGQPSQVLQRCQVRIPH